MLTNSIKLYDHVKLRDGRSGFVVEIYDQPDLPIGYEIELDNTMMELQTVTQEDIVEVLRS